MTSPDPVQTKEIQPLPELDQYTKYQVNYKSGAFEGVNSFSREVEAKEFIVFGNFSEWALRKITLLATN